VPPRPSEPVAPRFPKTTPASATEAMVKTVEMATTANERGNDFMVSDFCKEDTD
jgi:hypothetical protein